MDGSRCPICKKRLIAMTDRTSRTKLVCLKCDKIDPMKTDAVKWADSSLGRSAEFGRPAQISVTDVMSKRDHNTSTVKEGGFAVALAIGCLIILGISAAILHLQN